MTIIFSSYVVVILKLKEYFQTVNNRQNKFVNTEKNNIDNKLLVKQLSFVLFLYIGQVRRVGAHLESETAVVHFASDT